MNKSKILALTSAIVLVAAIGIGGTFSYFTDSKETPNAVKMGQLGIRLFETDEEDNYYYYKENEATRVFTDLEPGQVIHKDPTVEVAQNSASCFVRIKMDVKPTDSKGIAQDELDKLRIYEYGAPEKMDDEEYQDYLDHGRIVLCDGWTLNADGYYYYGFELINGDVATIFDEVVLPTTWTEMATADKCFEIVIEAEAVQSAVYNAVGDDGKPLLQIKHVDDDPEASEPYDKVVGWSTDVKVEQKTTN